MATGKGPPPGGGGRLIVSTVFTIYALLLIAAWNGHKTDAASGDTALHHHDADAALHPGLDPAAGLHAMGRRRPLQDKSSGGDRSGSGDADSSAGAGEDAGGGGGGGGEDSSATATAAAAADATATAVLGDATEKLLQQQQAVKRVRAAAVRTRGAAVRRQARVDSSSSNHPHHHPPPHEPTEAEAEAARVVGLILFIIVAGQYALHAWKARAMASYQKATLAGLWAFPCCFCAYFRIWKFVVFWVLYSLSTGRYVALTWRRPLPRDAPRRIYTWFNGMHHLSHGLVLVGYFVGLADFMGVNPAYVLLAVFRDPSNALHAPFAAQAELHTARMDAYHAATAKAHAHHVQGLPSDVERGEVDLGFEIAGSPTHEHAKGVVYFHTPPPPDPWCVEAVRIACALAVLLGLYFGVLTRDVAEVCTTEISTALGLSKKADDDEDLSSGSRSSSSSSSSSSSGGQLVSRSGGRRSGGGGGRGDWRCMDNLCSLCGEDLRPMPPAPSGNVLESGGGGFFSSEEERQRHLNQLALMSDPRLAKNGGGSGLGGGSGGGSGGGKAADDKSPNSITSPNNLIPQVVAGAAGCAGAMAGVAGATIETLDSLASKGTPIPLVTLPCGHVFHERCLRGWAIVGKQDTCPYCVERVDLKSVLGNSPWQKEGLVWLQLLDAVRYMVVWHPIILTIAHFSVRHILGYHPLVVDEHHPSHADHDHAQHLKPVDRAAG